MHIIVRENAQEICEVAAALVRAQLLRKPNCVLGLPTGSTPLPLYAELARLAAAGQADFSQVTTFNLDEYVGLPREHEQSYHNFMWTNLFSKIGVRPEQVNLPSGIATDTAAECARYEAAIDAAGGVDLQVLGIGHNGHIGFNEPAEAFSEQTCMVELTPSTIQANRRFFETEADVPRRALTMGIRTIFRAKEILLIAYGAAKADIIRQTVCGPIQPGVPSSVLQLHSNVHLLLDREAAAALSL